MSSLGKCYKIKDLLKCIFETLVVYDEEGHEAISMSPKSADGYGKKWYIHLLCLKLLYNADAS